MYHCNICFYLIGASDVLLKNLKEIPPLPHFTHKFAESLKPEETLVKQADVIVIDMSGPDAVKALYMLLSHKKKEAELLLLAHKEQIQELMERGGSEITDIWLLPLSDEEIQFRFRKWQETYKMAKDFWQNRNYLDSTINSVPHLIWFKDKEGAHMKVNNYFCKAVNKTMEQIEGRGHYYIWDIDPEEYAKGEFICMESEYEVMEKRKTCVFNENVKIGDSMRQLETYKSPLFDLDGSVMGTVGIAVDVTQERLYEQMIIKNANTDFLTGLYNRRFVYEYIEQMTEGHITIFCIDLNKFKSINDVYGHQEGDRALVLTANVLKECMPESLIARTGGDEFLIVMPGEHTEQEIEETRKMIEQRIDTAYAGEENFKAISASVGAAHSDKGKEAFDMLVGEADAFMYREKERKR
ncbi:MAG: GGDEF domain-containing protein [Lachnospiraceae bacterium]|nr:GGDEF domain-containing protein [Lachnospiraceae bacterium]